MNVGWIFMSSLIAGSVENQSVVMNHGFQVIPMHAHVPGLKRLVRIWKHIQTALSDDGYL
jgi:hypothetical protein